MTEVAPTLQRDAVRQAFEKVLSDENLTWRVDPDGDLIFLVQRQVHWVVFDAQDPMFVQLVMPRFFTLLNREEDLRRGYAAMNSVMQRVKLASVSMAMNDSGRYEAFAAVETLVPDLAMITPFVVMRWISSLQSAAHTFYQELMIAE